MIICCRESIESVLFQIYCTKHIIQRYLEHRALMCQLSVSHSVMSDSLQPHGSSRVLQARILERVAILFSRGSSWARDQTRVSCTAGGLFTLWATREVHVSGKATTILSSLLLYFLWAWHIFSMICFRQWDKSNINRSEKSLHMRAHSLGTLGEFCDYQHVNKPRRCLVQSFPLSHQGPAPITRHASETIPD